MSKVHAWMAQGAKQPLTPHEFDSGPLGPDEAEIAVQYCGLCHSDLSLVNNDWGGSKYPFTPGHEVVGTVVALGEHTRGLKVGQTVGVGWNSGSCMHCLQCISGNQHLCPELASTITGYHGGFSSRIRAHWQWVFPLPEGLDASAASPLMCGGITVFASLVINNIKPTSHVGIVGIGGLGHMGIKFAKAWGCEVTAFTHTASKRKDCRRFGADHVLSSVDSDAIRTMAGKLDMLLICVNISLDWSAFISTLAPRGRIHIVGIVEKPIEVIVLDHLVNDQHSISGSPAGSPANIRTMLEFAARHRVVPQVEHMPMSKINEAFRHLESGKPRYRVVLDADFAT